MILAGSTFSQSYLAQGYQTTVTGANSLYPNPPASSSAWSQETPATAAVWTEESLPSTP